MDFELALKHLTKSQNPTGVLRSFVGGYDFVSSSAADNKYVAFKFKQTGKDGSNYCRISLASDLYTIELGQVNKFDYEVKSTQNGIYWEDLKSSFEDATGLFLSFS